MPYTGSYTLTARCLTEFMGTFCAISFGDGVVANALLSSTGGNGMGAGWIAFGFGMAFTFPIMMFGYGSSYFNPAMALAGLMRNEISVRDYFALAASQMVAGFCAGIFVYLLYLPHFQKIPEVSMSLEDALPSLAPANKVTLQNLLGNSSKVGDASAKSSELAEAHTIIAADQGKKLGVLCTRPAIFMPIHNFFVELMGTATIVVGANLIGSRMSMITSSADMQALGIALQPFLVGMLIMTLILAMGGPTGFAANPARDMGPRLAHMLLPIPGKGTSEFSYGIMINIGMLLGGVLGGALIMAMDQVRFWTL
ncbi:aquaporin-like protein [Chytriomyces sp. MP71]|nr:aquaporin-like protein [Chytriomyces sp. MP71]